MAMSYHRIDGNLEGNIQWLVKVKSLVECIKICINTDTCYGVNWTSADRKCEFVKAPVQVTSRTEGVNSYTLV